MNSRLINYSLINRCAWGRGEGHMAGGTWCIDPRPYWISAGRTACSCGGPHCPLSPAGDTRKQETHASRRLTPHINIQSHFPAPTQIECQLCAERSAKLAPAHKKVWHCDLRQSGEWSWGGLGIVAWQQLSTFAKWNESGYCESKCSFTLKMAVFQGRK